MPTSGDTGARQLNGRLEQKTCRRRLRVWPGGHCFLEMPFGLPSSMIVSRSVGRPPSEAQRWIRVPIGTVLPLRHPSPPSNWDPLAVRGVEDRNTLPPCSRQPSPSE